MGCGTGILPGATGHVPVTAEATGQMPVATGRMPVPQPVVDAGLRAVLPTTARPDFLDALLDRRSECAYRLP